MRCKADGKAACWVDSAVCMGHGITSSWAQILLPTQVSPCSRKPHMLATGRTGSFLHACFACLLACLPTKSPLWQSTCLPTHLPACLPTYLPTHLVAFSLNPTFLHTGSLIQKYPLSKASEPTQETYRSNLPPWNCPQRE